MNDNPLRNLDNPQNKHPSYRILFLLSATLKLGRYIGHAIEHLYPQLKNKLKDDSEDSKNDRIKVSKRYFDIEKQFIPCPDLAIPVIHQHLKKFYFLSNLTSCEISLLGSGLEKFSIKKLPCTEEDKKMNFYQPTTGYFVPDVNSAYKINLSIQANMMREVDRIRERLREVVTVIGEKDLDWFVKLINKVSKIFFIFKLAKTKRSKKHPQSPTLQNQSQISSTTSSQTPP